MTLRDGYRYVVYLLAVLVVTAPHYAFGVTPHRYLDISLSPLHQAVGWSSGTLNSLERWTLSRSRFIEKFSRLQRVNDRLKQQNKSLRLIARRYRRLRNEAGLPSDTSTFQPLSATVQRSHLTAWERTVEINRGTHSGVSAGDPVVNVIGDSWVLYGQILETFPGRSRVMTTSDPRFKMGVVIEGVPGRQFVARGSGQNGLAITHFPRVLDVPLNASVRTAPASTIAPRGISVGTVRRLTQAEARPGEGNELWLDPMLSDSIPTVVWVLTDP